MDQAPPPHVARQTGLAARASAWRLALAPGTFTTGALVMENSDGSGGFISMEADANNFDGNPDWAPDASAVCQPVSVDTLVDSPVSIPLSCADQGPAWERTDVTESIRDGPTKGTLGPVQQGNPATVVYTPNPTVSGTDSFTFRGIDQKSFSQTVTATIRVLLRGRCANLQTGTNGSDTLLGTAFGDRLRALGANDTLSGLAGNDCLEGGAGSDKLTANAGADRLVGAAGNDVLNAGDGNDVLIGGGGNDVLIGGKGKNSYFGGRGSDRINARNGRREVVNCGKGVDRARVDRSGRVIGCETVRRP